MGEKHVQVNDHGETLLAWQFKEYHVPHRTTKWYFVATVIAGLLLLYSIWTANFMFGIIIILVALIYFLYDVHDAPETGCAITTGGIFIGRRFFKYKDVRDFWVVYKPGEVTALYVEPRGLSMGKLSVPLEDQDPLHVREILLQYVPESQDHDDEPLSESLGRMLRL